MDYRGMHSAGNDRSKSSKMYTLNRKSINRGSGTMDKDANNGVAKNITSPCDVEALKKCLEENKGDYIKCQAHIEAFKSSCSLKKPNSSSQ